MNIINRTLGIIPVLILLSGCSQLVSGMDTPTEVAPVASQSQAVTRSFLSTASPFPSTATIEISPTISASYPTSDQQTGDKTSQDVAITPGACDLIPVVQPPKPDETFGPNELDPESGLHVTGLPQWIDITTYRLQVTGLVDHPLSLSYDDLRCMPSVTDNPDLICPGYFNDKATWSGVPIQYILELAGVQKEATQLTLVSADGYRVKVTLEQANAGENFLAYQVNGKLLPVLHGFPLRAVFPSMYGSYWIKWLIEIQIS